MFHSSDKYTKHFAISLLVILATAFICANAAAATGTTTNESLNKDHQTAAAAAIPSMSPQTSPVHSVIVDHSDLPTRFGDEDDVIESKNSDKKTGDNNGNHSKKGKFGSS